MSAESGSTPLGRVRALGSAHHGGEAAKLLLGTAVIIDHDIWQLGRELLAGL